MENSFHGRTFGALATTGQTKYRAPFVPLVPGVTFVKFNDLDDLQRKFDSSVCAVCIETIQGEGGICPVNKEFLELAARLTKQSGALLVLDEIQCGLGRTGRHFAYQHYGVLPDVVTVAKPLACGLPLGAILTTERVASCMHPGMHGTTFGGGPLACAVAIEFLREEKKLLKHVRALGEYFHAALEALDKKHKSIQEVRGVGLMQAMEVDSPELAKAVARQLLQEGIIINRTHETVLRFLPPYVIQKEHVDRLVKALDAALRKNAESTHKEEKVGPSAAQTSPCARVRRPFPMPSKFTLSSRPTPATALCCLARWRRFARMSATLSSWSRTDESSGAALSTSMARTWPRFVPSPSNPRTKRRAAAGAWSMRCWRKRRNTKSPACACSRAFRNFSRAWGSGLPRMRNFPIRFIRIAINAPGSIAATKWRCSGAIPQRSQFCRRPRIG